MTISIPKQYQSLKTKLETIVKKVVSPQEIPVNSDLNDYTEAGFYYCGGNTISQTLTNNPTSDAFSLLVEKNGVGDGVKQTYTTYRANSHHTYVRTMYTDDWTDPSHPTNVWGSWQLYFQDTGWQDLSFASGFNHFWTEQKAQYRRIGKIVHIRGAIKNTNEISANDTKVKMATITDATCRPSQEIHYIQQGSGTGVHLITIFTNGEVNISRNRLTGTSGYSKIGAGSWLNIEHTFFVD